MQDAGIPRDAFGHPEFMWEHISVNPVNTETVPMQNITCALRHVRAFIVAVQTNNFEAAIAIARNVTYCDEIVCGIAEVIHMRDVMCNVDVDDMDVRFLLYAVLMQTGRCPGLSANEFPDAVNGNPVPVFDINMLVGMLELAYDVHESAQSTNLRHVNTRAVVRGMRVDDALETMKLISIAAWSAYKNSSTETVETQVESMLFLYDVYTCIEDHRAGCMVGHDERLQAIMNHTRGTWSNASEAVYAVALMRLEESGKGTCVAKLWRGHHPYMPPPAYLVHCMQATHLRDYVYTGLMLYNVPVPAADLIDIDGFCILQHRITKAISELYLVYAEQIVMHSFTHDEFGLSFRLATQMLHDELSISDVYPLIVTCIDFCTARELANRGECTVKLFAKAIISLCHSLLECYDKTRLYALPLQDRVRGIVKAVSPYAYGQDDESAFAIFAGACVQIARLVREFSTEVRRVEVQSILQDKHKAADQVLGRAMALWSSPNDPSARMSVLLVFTRAMKRVITDACSSAQTGLVSDLAMLHEHPFVSEPLPEGVTSPKHCVDALRIEITREMLLSIITDEASWATWSKLLPDEAEWLKPLRDEYVFQCTHFLALTRPSKSSNFSSAIGMWMHESFEKAATKSLSLSEFGPGAHDYDHFHMCMDFEDDSATLCTQNQGLSDVVARVYTEQPTQGMVTMLTDLWRDVFSRAIQCMTSKDGTVTPRFFFVSELGRLDRAKRIPVPLRECMFRRTSSLMLQAVGVYKVHLDTYGDFYYQYLTRATRHCLSATEFLPGGLRNRILAVARPADFPVRIFEPRPLYADYFVKQPASGLQVKKHKKSSKTKFSKPAKRASKQRAAAVHMSPIDEAVAPAGFSEDRAGFSQGPAELYAGLDAVLHTQGIDRSLVSHIGSLPIA